MKELGDSIADIRQGEAKVRGSSGNHHVGSEGKMGWG